MKHTKGTWITGKPNVDTFYVLAADGNFICMLPAKEENSEANAKLIAASPELLSCLEDAIIGMEWRIDSEPTTLDKSDYEKLNEWKAAIKKATI